MFGDMRFHVVVLPEFPWSIGAEVWKRCEELGFDHAWTYDHLAWRELRDHTWYDAVPTLAAAALATTTIRLGPLVASPNFRHPVHFARELLALDDISGGRITAGIGAGGGGWDAKMLGGPDLSVGDRAARFREFVELTDALLTSSELSHDGRFYQVVEARTYPGCVQEPRIPFAIAAPRRRGMGAAARFADMWVTTGDRSRTAGALVPPEEGASMVARQVELLQEVCEGHGRDPATIKRLVVLGPDLDQCLDSPARFDECAGRYADAGATDIAVHWPRANEPYACDVGMFESIFSR